MTPALVITYQTHPGGRQFLKRGTVTVKPCRLASELLPALNDDVTVPWIDFHHPAVATHRLRGYERRAGTSEKIYHQVAFPGAISQSMLCEFEGFGSGVKTVR